MWSVIFAVVKLITLFLTEKVERDRDKRFRKREIRKDLSAAIKKRDRSEITKAFDRMKEI